MKFWNASDLDLFNYYAIQYLESLGNIAPNNSEIERMEGMIKRWFTIKIDSVLHKLIINENKSFEILRLSCLRASRNKKLLQ